MDKKQKILKTKKAKEIVLETIANTDAQKRDLLWHSTFKSMNNSNNKRATNEQLMFVVTLGIVVIVQAIIIRFILGLG